MRYTYQEQPKGVAYPFHEQLILAEILLVDVEDLAIVEPADEEEGKEEAYDHVDSRKSQQAHGEAEGKGDKLAAPEHEVKQFILRYKVFMIRWGLTFSVLDEWEKARCSFDFILINSYNYENDIIINSF